MSGIGSIGAKTLIQHLRPAAGAAPVAKMEAVAAEKPLSPAEIEVQNRFKALQDTHAMVVLPAESEALVALFGTGKLEQGKLFIHNVDQNTQQNRGFSALVLSDEGKKALASSKTLDEALGKRLDEFGSALDLPCPLDLQRHVQQVLVDDTAYASLMSAYEKAAAEGAVPKLLGGKPPAQFINASEDFYNHFQVEQFGRNVPGFAQRPLIEQKATAALAGKAASLFPSVIPTDIRHRVASSMVSHKAYNTPLKTDGLDVVGEVKDFFHGRQIIGRSGQPLRAPETLMDEGFHPDEKGAFGMGVYHANPSVARGYGLSEIDKPGSILSGKVALGNVTRDATTQKAEFEANRDFHTYRVKSRDMGDYFVTKDPRRFFITGITRYNPDATVELGKVLPDLMKAATYDPHWAATYLNRLPQAQVNRAHLHALKHGTEEEKLISAVMLAVSGDARGLKAFSQTIDRAKNLGDRSPANLFKYVLTFPESQGGPQLHTLSTGLLKRLDPSKLDEQNQINLVKDVRSFINKLEPQQFEETKKLLLSHPSALIRQSAAIEFLHKGDARCAPLALEAMANPLAYLTAVSEKELVSFMTTCSPQQLGESRQVVSKVLSRVRDYLAWDTTAKLVETHGTAIKGMLQLHPNPMVRQSLGLAMLRDRLIKGDPTSVAETMKLLRAHTPAARTATAKALMPVILEMDPARAAEVQQLLRLMFTVHPELTEDSAFIIKLAKRFGASVFGGTKLEGTNRALIEAAGTESPETLKTLIQAGADVHFGDGWTALHSAAYRNNLPAITTLLEAGSKLESEGTPVLLRAAAGGHVEAMELLISKGANVLARDPQGYTALHALAFAPEWKSSGFELLRKAQVDLNATAHEKNTPLHVLTLRDQAGGVRDLLKAGADFSLKNEQGFTALEIAKLGNHQDVIKVFEEAGITA